MHWATIGRQQWNGKGNSTGYHLPKCPKSGCREFVANYAVGFRASFRENAIPGSERCGKNGIWATEGSDAHFSLSLKADRSYTVYQRCDKHEAYCYQYA